MSKFKMTEPSMSEKLKLIFKSSKSYRGVLLIGLLFICIGVVLIYIGLHFDIIFLIVFGSIFIAVALFFLIYTIPSSVIYAYDKALLKKYGKYANATILEKEIINNSYHDKNTYAADSSTKGSIIEEFNYTLKFSFEYQNQIYKNTDFVEKNEFEKLNNGDLIPIHFLRTAPKKSFIRKVKLKNSTNKITN